MREVQLKIRVSSKIAWWVLARPAVTDWVVNLHITTRVYLIILLRCHPLATLLLIGFHLRHLVTLKGAWIVLEARAFLPRVVLIEVWVLQIHHKSLTRTFKGQVSLNWCIVAKLPSYSVFFLKFLSELLHILQKLFLESALEREPLGDLVRNCRQIQKDNHNIWLLAIVLIILVTVLD